MSKSFLPCAAILTLAGWLGLPAASSAAILVFTDQTLYDTARGGGAGFVQDFSGYDAGHHDILFYSGGDPLVEYTIISGSLLWRNDAPNEYGSWLTSESQASPLILSVTTGNAQAFGGNFFLTDNARQAVAGTFDILIHTSMEDVTGEPIKLTLNSVATGPQPFLGIVATGDDLVYAFSMVPTESHATFTNFQVTPVAVPEASALALGVLGGCGLLRRRRC